MKTFSQIALALGIAGGIMAAFSIIVDVSEGKKACSDDLSSFIGMYRGKTVCQDNTGKMFMK